MQNSLNAQMGTTQTQFCFILGIWARFGIIYFLSKLYKTVNNVFPIIPAKPALPRFSGSCHDVTIKLSSEYCSGVQFVCLLRMHIMSLSKTRSNSSMF